MNAASIAARDLAIARSMAAVPPVEGRDFELMPSGSEAPAPVPEDGLDLSPSSAGAVPRCPEKNAGAFRPVVPACDDFLTRCSSPDAEPLLSLAGASCFAFTEEQRSHLSFAAMCQAEDLERSKEANEPEVQEAIRSLWESRRILEAGRPL
jgi:hypothetical protein